MKSTATLLACALLAAPAARAQVLSHIDFENQVVGSDITSITENGHTWFTFAGTTADNPEATATVPGTDIRKQSAPATLVAGDFSPGFGYLETEGDAFSLSDTDWTIECFVRFSAVGGFQTILGRDRDPAETRTSFADLYFQKDSGDRFSCSYVAGFINNGGGNYTIDRPYVQSDGLVAIAGRWYHLAVVYDGTARTLTLYVNRDIVAQLADANNIAPVTNPVGEIWSVGRGYYAGNPVDNLNGQIDDLRITAAALTPDQFLAAGVCNADINNDGSVDMFDVIDFLVGVDAGCN
ncbi:MAG: LamG domain-containing protein [Phycisphaeraceae bacterium]|nr:MAG: LamG domain-containing protein [Phycisphaeraceae bacterium]